jgi:phage baseplate assembly protein W
MAKKNFLGRGWRFPLGVGASGGIATSEYEKNIEESIEIILGTAPGERVYRGGFGCEIHDLVFQPNNSETAGKACRAVSRALTVWEPRIGNLAVNAYYDALEDNKLLIDIQYEVRATNNRLNMVYPFYLRREQDQ